MARLLLVDDSKFQRRYMSRMLLELGHEVFDAENGEIALNMLESTKPDIVITDLLMPVLDGVNLLRGLKLRGSAVPAIVVSADIQETTKDECRTLGAVDFLNKPVNSASLERALSRFLTPSSSEKSKC